MLKLNKKTVLFLIFFAVCTFFIMINHIPFRDETISWLIAKHFDFFELFQAERYEGHLFIWHALLMPFAKNDFFYPYSMFIINWIFAFLSIVVLWNYSPFSDREKFLISLSYPFFIYFPVVARCYSIGVFILFIILSLWKNRLKHPYLIPFLIMLLANTSAMALIVAMPIGLIYIFNLFKEKKNLLSCLIIFILGSALILYQIGGAVNPNQDLVWWVFIKRIKTFIFQENTSPLCLRSFNVIFALSSFSLIFGAFFTFLKKREVFFFFITSYLLLFSLLSFKYHGQWWHYLFFFVYMIASIWLFRLDCPKDNDNKLFNNLFLFLLCCFTIKTLIFPVDYWAFAYEEKNPDLYSPARTYLNKSDRIYDTNAALVGVAPYLGTNLYDKFGNKRFSLNGFRQNMNTKEASVDVFAKSLDDKNRNIIFSNEPLNNEYGENYDVLYTKIYQDDTPVIIYLIQKQEHKK